MVVDHIEDAGNREEANRSLTGMVTTFGKDEAFADLIEAQHRLQKMTDCFSEKRARLNASE